MPKLLFIEVPYGERGRGVPSFKKKKLECGGVARRMVCILHENQDQIEHEEKRNKFGRN